MLRAPATAVDTCVRLINSFLIFGDEWLVAGEYVKILAPMFGVRFVTSSLAMGLIVAGVIVIHLFSKAVNH